jgi:SLOG in TRPM, prokaryote
MVLIGGEIDKQQARVTWHAMQTIARIAEDINAVVICGGTNMGVMAEIGQIKWRKKYKFPLVGITLEEWVARQPVCDDPHQWSRGFPQRY